MEPGGGPAGVTAQASRALYLISHVSYRRRRLLPQLQFDIGAGAGETARAALPRVSLAQQLLRVRGMEPNLGPPRIVLPKARGIRFEIEAECLGAVGTFPRYVRRFVYESAREISLVVVIGSSAANLRQVR